MTQFMLNRITSQPNPPVPDHALFTQRDLVATVTKNVFNNFADASHSEFCSDDPNPILQLTDGTVVPAIRKAKLGDRVTFCGCVSSECKICRAVFSTKWCGKVRYKTIGKSKFVKKFFDQILFTPLSVEGESGSLLIHEGTKKAVGLIFTGIKCFGIATPIKTILDELAVDLPV